MQKIILLGLACFGLTACVSGNGFAPFITHSQANADSVQMVSVDGLGGGRTVFDRARLCWEI